MVFVHYGDISIYLEPPNGRCVKTSFETYLSKCRNGWRRKFSNRSVIHLCTFRLVFSTEMHALLNRVIYRIMQSTPDRSCAIAKRPCDCSCSGYRRRQPDIWFSESGPDIGIPYAAETSYCDFVYIKKNLLKVNACRCFKHGSLPRNSISQYQIRIEPPERFSIRFTKLLPN